ncbi:MAG TPA: DUF6069 family protein [Actinopolymorphaceae bacterium]
MTTPRRWSVLPASAVAAVIVWAVAVPIAGIDLVARAGSRVQHVGIGSVIAVSLVVALVATVVRIALARATRARPGQGARAWVVLASVVLLVSLAGPAGAVTASAGWSLAGMHVVVGALPIVGLRTTGTGTHAAS